MQGLKPYVPPYFLFNAHLETIYPALFRKVEISGIIHEEIKTPDNDFLELDWLRTPSNKVVIIQHGLEGSADRAYVRGMMKAFYAQGFDSLAWNYRGCGRQMNQQLRFYHSGATDDLKTVVDHAAERYEEIYLIGFSLGGNVTLKYLGEPGPHHLVKKAIVFSVPLHLESSCRKISLPGNAIYARRFLRSLKKKIQAKAKLMSGIDTAHLSKIKTLIDFDDHYTAPLHGFKNARDYYDACSAIHFIPNIQVPVLIVNTKNDPFLSEECFPCLDEIAPDFVKMETPLRGGHVGFMQHNKTGLYWSEQRALDWIINGR